MGGAAAEVSDGTTGAILLESAYFEASGIAKTSSGSGCAPRPAPASSAASIPNDVAAGAARAMELLAEVAAAGRDPGVVDVYPNRLYRHASRCAPIG